MSALAEQALNAWRVHNDIHLHLVSRISKAGLKAVPAGSKGRNVAQQFAHTLQGPRGLAVHRQGRQAAEAAPPTEGRHAHHWRN